MKLKRLITIMLGLTLLLTAFVVGAYALDTNVQVDWDSYTDTLIDETVELEDQILDVGDFNSYESENNNVIPNNDELRDDYTHSAILEWGDVDNFRFDIKGTSTIVLMTGATAKRLTFRLLDENGNVLINSDYTDYSNYVYFDGLAVTVAPGTYYMSVYDPNYSYYYQSYYTPIEYFAYFCVDTYHDYGYGQIGDDAYWLVTTDKVLHIYGNGPTYDLDNWYGQPWERSFVSSVSIEEGITYVGTHLFSDCANIKSLFISDTVEKIGVESFSNCQGLTDIVIDTDILTFDERSFSNSWNITSLTVYGNKVTIGGRAFSSCSKLKSVKIVADDIVLYGACFSGCYAASDYVFDGNISVLGPSVFNYCGLKEIELSGDFSEIPISLFGNCSQLENPIIHAEINAIREQAFFCCESLAELNVRGEIEYVGKQAFYWCSNLKDASFLNYTKYIGNNAFNKCSSLSQVGFSSELEQIEDFAFADCKSLSTLVFNGDMPIIAENTFQNVTATVYYPVENATYTEDMMLDYGGDLTWVAHTHSYGEGTVITEAFDTTDGEILYHCPDCGHEYTVIVPAPNPFDDVIFGKFYYNPVMWALENNITKGITDSTFEPDTGCSRGQVVTFLWRAAGCPEPTSTEHNFTDVRKGAYYYKAMLWAVEQGITVGTTKTTFAPDDTCTRGQVVTFLWRAAGSPAAVNREHSFTDVRENGYYFKAMLWAVENGITKGTTKTEFAPDDTCNRGQVVTFLYRQYA